MSVLQSMMKGSLAFTHKRKPMQVSFLVIPVIMAGTRESWKGDTRLHTFEISRLTALYRGSSSRQLRGMYQ